MSEAKILFTKGAKRDIAIGTGDNPRLPNKFEVAQAEASTPAGTYCQSADKAWLFLKPYQGKMIAIPVNKIQTFIETDPKPADPLA